MNLGCRLFLKERDMAIGRFFHEVRVDDFLNGGRSPIEKHRIACRLSPALGYNRK